MSERLTSRLSPFCRQYKVASVDIWHVPGYRARVARLMRLAMGCAWQDVLADCHGWSLSIAGRGQVIYMTGWDHPTN